MNAGRVAQLRAGGRRPARRGTVLIAMTLIVLILASLVLVMARSARVEAVASRNYAAMAQAEAAERAGEGYAMSLVQTQLGQVMQLTDDYFDQIPVADGDGYFWIIRPYYGNLDAQSDYGFMDESQKVNLTLLAGTQAQTAVQQLQDLFSQQSATASSASDLVQAIQDWQSGGGDTSYYGNAPSPYRSKQGAMESVEELLLVRGFDRSILYGDRSGPYVRPMGSSGMLTATNGTNKITPPEEEGIFDGVTVWPRVTPGQAAPTGVSAYSCEIVAASADFRAFKCVRVVIQVTTNATSAPRLVYRRDVTDGGWPWGADDLEQLRQNYAATGGRQTQRSGT